MITKAEAFRTRWSNNLADLTSNEIGEVIIDAVRCILEAIENRATVPAEIARLELKPGEVLVLKHPHRLTEEARANLRTEMKKVLGDVQVVVLQEGMELSTVGAVS